MTIQIFVPEEQLGLRCWTKILTTCVVVDVSKYLGILTLQDSTILERPPLWLGSKMTLRVLLVLRILVALLWETRSRSGCQGPQRKYADYLSTTLRKLKVSDIRNSTTIRQMMRKEMKWMEKSKRSEVTLFAHMKHEDDYGMNEDSNLSRSVRMSKQVN